MSKGLKDEPKGEIKDSPEKRGRVRRLVEKEEILRYLDQNRAYAATAMEHMDPHLFKDTQWFVTEPEPFALCLMARGSFGNILFTMGDPDGLEIIHRREPGPRQAYITCQREHLNLISSLYVLRGQQTMMRMGTSQQNFKPMSGQAVRLHHDQMDQINELYRKESWGPLYPRQIRDGVYYGIWQDDHLVAVAGTQMISYNYNIAIIANVLTHPQYRNRSYATICTSAVTAELLGKCRDVVLNVDPNNGPAINAYSKLGYKDEGTLVEAWGFRRGGILGSLAGLLEKVGL